MIFIFVRRKQAKNDPLKSQEEINDVERNFDNFRDQLKLSKSKKTESEVKSICETFIFDGEIANQICSISKIPFRNDEVVLRCPFCKKNFKEKFQRKISC